MTQVLKPDRTAEAAPGGTMPGPQTGLRVGLLLALVALNIALQLANAALIKFASGLSKEQMGLVIAMLVTVAGLSFSRFVVWGAMHKRFPVSIAYPATALFFPCLVAVAAAFGESVSTAQISGAGLVTAGVLLLLLPTRSGQDESLA